MTQGHTDLVPGVSGLPAPAEGEALHGLAERVAEAYRAGRIMKFIDWGSKGVPRRVPGDDNARVVMENDDEILVQVSPSTTRFLAHYGKKTDLLHFIVDGQVALVPPDWLHAFNRGLRRTRGRLGHDTPQALPELPKVTVADRIKFALRMFRRAIIQPRVVADPVVDLMGPEALPAPEGG